jgi:hypothetical protein
MLSTAEFGYTAGTAELTSAIDIIVPTLPTGLQSALWGFYDSQNGCGFGVDATGLFLFVRNLGTDTLVRPNNWNGDPLNGTGSSGVTLNLSQGNTFITTSYYMGSINFSVVVSINGIQKPIVIHQYGHAEPIISALACPIRAEVFNDTTTTNFTMLVGNRDCSVARFSDNDPTNRDVSHFRITTITTGSEVGVQNYKLANPWVAVAFVEFETILSEATLFRLVQNTSLLSPSWTAPFNQIQSESVVNVDVTASPGNTSLTVFQWLAPVGYNKVKLLTPSPLIRNQNFSLLATVLSPTAAAAFINSRWQENW